MRDRVNRWLTAMLAVLSVWCGVIAAPAEAQTDYTYTIIADVTNCYNIGAPALNDNGEVAFGATCGSISIRRGDGGALTSIYSWDASSGTQHVPQTDVLSINDGGVVAFAVNGPCPNGGAAAIWTGDGGPIDIAHDICTQPGFTSVLRAVDQ